MQALNLADFPVKYGILRADKLRLFRTPVTVTLGAYGFPDSGDTEIIRKMEGKAKAIILKGYNGMNRPIQLAMTVYDGWDGLDIVKGVNTNPDSEKSLTVYAVTRRTEKYGYENFILISQVITKESHDDFTEDELFPIEKVQYGDPEEKGGYGPVRIILKWGEEKTVDFDGIEGEMRL